MQTHTLNNFNGKMNTNELRIPQTKSLRSSTTVLGNWVPVHVPSRSTMVITIFFIRRRSRIARP